jgi:hypothetical protein
MARQAVVGINFTGKESGVTESVNKTKNSLAGLVRSFVDIKAIMDVAVRGFNLIRGAAIGLVSEYMDATTASTKLGQVLESTGNKLGLSQAYLQKYATSLQDITGIDDDLIGSNMAMMATFTSIGKDVFPEAIARAADMTDMFGSMEAATMQVGKALNDPIAGVGALRRVGVQLTDQQEAMIKSFVAVGNVAGAQQIILKELKGEFGGVAEAIGNTFVGSMRKLEANLGFVKELLGEQIANFIKGPIDKINEFIVTHRTQITNAVQSLPEIFKLTYKLILDIIKTTFAKENIGNLFKPMIDVFLATWSAGLELLPTMISGIFEVGGPLLEIITLSLFNSIGAGMAKAFNVDITKDKEYIKYNKMIEEDYKKLGAGLSNVFEKSGPVIDKYISKVKDIGKASLEGINPLTDQYDKDLIAILNKPLEKSDSKADIVPTVDTSPAMKELTKFQTDLKMLFSGGMVELKLLDTSSLLKSFENLEGPAKEIFTNFYNSLDALHLQKTYGLIDNTSAIQDSASLAKQTLQQLANIGFGKTEEELKKVKELLDTIQYADKTLTDAKAAQDLLAKQKLQQYKLMWDIQPANVTSQIQPVEERKKDTRVAEFFSSSLTLAGDGLMYLVNQFVSLVTATDAWKSVMDSFSSTLIGIVEFVVTPLINAIQPLFTIIIALVSVIANYAVVAFEQVGLFIQAILPSLIGFGNVIIAIAKLFLTLLDPVLKLGALLFTTLNPIFNSLTSTIDVLGGVVTMLLPVFNFLGKVIQTVVAPVLATIGATFTWLVNILHNFGQFVTNMINDFWNSKNWAITGMKETNLAKLIADSLAQSQTSMSATATATGAWAPMIIPTTDFNMESLFSDQQTVTGFENITPGTSGGGLYGGGTTITQVPDIHIHQYFNQAVIGEGGKASIGRYMVEAIQEYMGTGGKVTWLENPA